MDAPGADLFVFDFDGTLVDSAAAKRQAFYDLFPSDCAAAVTAVLQRDPDGSRHALIPEMICLLDVPSGFARPLKAAFKPFMLTLGRH